MTVFIDSFALIAWINPREPYHAAVKKHLNVYFGKFVTTEWVVMEFADALSSPAFRAVAVNTIQHLRTNRLFDIVPYDPAVFQAGFDLYAARPDKAWSLTDCISFGVMHDLGLTDALTADRHFAQAGFNPVFAAP